MEQQIQTTLQKLNNKWHLDHISRKVLTRIDNWLSQFKEEDKIHALKVFDKLDYVSHNDISNFLYEFHQNILNFFSEDEIAIIPVVQVKWENENWKFDDSTVKSGHIMQTLYLMNNSTMLEFEANSKSPFTKGVQKFYENASCLIFVDDFVGTGKTVADFIRAFFNEYRISKNTKVFLVCYGIMESAYMVLERSFTKIICKKKYPGLFDDSSIWGTDDHLKIKDTMKVYELGFDSNGEGDKYHYLFGYGQTASSVFFQHNTPNNNLSTLWQNLHNSIINQPWKPILIRYRKGKGFYYKTIIESYKVNALMAREYD